MIYPSVIADNLINQMKNCKTQKEMNFIWSSYKENEKDKNIIEAVENFIRIYRSGYIAQSTTDIYFIKERVLGEFKNA